jgi:hypothetical protein
MKSLLCITTHEIKSHFLVQVTLTALVVAIFSNHKNQVHAQALAVDTR